MPDPRERLIVALDVSSVAEAEAMVARLGDAVVFYKIGYQLGFAGGLDFARALIDTGKQVFVDMKLHDIGNTVAQGVKSVASMGASFLTVHAYPQTMHAAVDARAGSKLRILAVTVLTSYDDADLAAAGYDFTVPELVAERAAQARDIGIDGLVCSAAEAANVRTIVGRGMVLVTPGHPAGGRRRRRPEAHHDAGGRDQGRRRLSRGRPAGRGGFGSEGGGGGDCRGDRGGQSSRGEAMPKGYWIAHVDVHDADGLQVLPRRQSREPQEVRRPVRRARRPARAVRRARAAAATCCANFRTTPRRSPATARRNIRRTSKCANRTRLSIS